MIFCCTSSKHRKPTKKVSNSKPIDSSSTYSAATYASISSSSIPKSDSGFSENSSSRELISSVEQLIVFERIFHQNLKENISKYSRPLRRYLNRDEIVQLFQNIEKISNISESILRQCEKTVQSNHLFIYQSWSGILIESYRLYLLRYAIARRTLEENKEKIAFYLQIPLEIVRREMSNFLLLPIRHIGQIDEFFHSFNTDYADRIDQSFAQALKILAEQATFEHQPLTTQEENSSSSSSSSDDLSFLPENSSIIVLKRTNGEPWESKCVEFVDSRLIFTNLDRSLINSSICLSNVIQIRTDLSFEEVILIVVQSSTKMPRQIHLRFENSFTARTWTSHLAMAIQKAKDQIWNERKELIL